jgi:hypothetical protein
LEAGADGQVMTFLLLALSVIKYLTEDRTEGDDAKEESYEEDSSDADLHAEENSGEEKEHARVESYK